MRQPTIQLPKVGKTEKNQRQSPNSRKYDQVRTREHLLSRWTKIFTVITKK